MDAHIKLEDIAHNRSDHFWAMVLHPPCSAGVAGRPVPMFAQYTQSGALAVIYPDNLGTIRNAFVPRVRIATIFDVLHVWELAESALPTPSGAPVH